MAKINTFFQEAVVAQPRTKTFEDPNKPDPLVLTLLPLVGVTEQGIQLQKQMELAGLFIKQGEGHTPAVVTLSNNKALTINFETVKAVALLFCMQPEGEDKYDEMELFRLSHTHPVAFERAYIYADRLNEAVTQKKIAEVWGDPLPPPTPSASTGSEPGSSDAPSTSEESTPQSQPIPQHVSIVSMLQSGS